MQSLITPNQAWIIYAAGNEAIARNDGGGFTSIIVESHNMNIW